jgi:predicted O-methyltransferase YrrM
MIPFRRSLRQFDAFRRVYEATPARHKEASIIASADDELTRPTERLFDVALSAANLARAVEFADLSDRASDEPRWQDVWPGEHYKLLAALVGALRARNVIEIGTSTGMGSLAIAQALPPDGALTTFDIVPWRDFPRTWLREDDFSRGRIRQEIADISRPGAIEPFSEVFRAADFIFIDGPKDGVAEAKFLAALNSLELSRDPIVMLDDIRVLNMIEIWRRLDRPKLDLTSFGHWSGTGLVDWNG